MAQRTNKEYAIALYQVTQQAPASALDAVLKNFVQVLYKDQKLRHAGAIIAEFEAYAKKQAGVVSIAITSARELDTSTIQIIKKIFGEKVEATEHIDENLIGGFVVREENKIFDASLKTQLTKLKLSLM